MSVLLPYTQCTARTRETTRLVRIDMALPLGFYVCTNVLTGKQSTHHEHDLTPMQTIPSRLREHLFAQVAPHIGTALNSWPVAVRFEPKPLTGDTFARRLREAMQAKRTYAWKHSSIDEAKWKEHSEELVCSLEASGKVVLGPRKFDSEKAIGAPVQVAVTAAEIWLESSDEIETICRLLHRKSLRPAPIIKVRGLTQDQRDSLEGRYDVAVVPIEDDENVSQIMS